MFNDNLIYVVILIAVLLAAVGVNALIQFRDEMNRRRMERLNWLSEQSSHTLNALAVLKQTGCRAEIIEKLDQHAMSLIEEMAALSPKLDLAVPDANDLNTPPDPQPLTSDRAIKRAQIYINFAEKLILDMARAGRLTMQLAQSYKQELYWLSITVVADGHIQQAKILEAENQPLAALSHLKHAKAVMVRAMLPESHKKAKVEELQRDIDRLKPMEGPKARLRTLSR